MSDAAGRLGARRSRRAAPSRFADARSRNSGSDEGCDPLRVAAFLNSLQTRAGPLCPCGCEQGEPIVARRAQAESLEPCSCEPSDAVPPSFERAPPAHSPHAPPAHCDRTPPLLTKVSASPRPSDRQPRPRSDASGGFPFPASRLPTGASKAMAGPCATS